jgi:hypothetical protein
VELRKIDGAIILPDAPTTQVDGRGFVHHVPPRGAAETVRLALKQKLDLRGADFTALSLRNIVFSGVDLSGACFRFADLESVHFDHCKLAGCDFRGADCFGANLSQAIVDGADFSNANLTNALLTFASFAGAKFDGAKLNGARLSDVLREHLAKIERDRALREFLLGDAPLDPDLAERLREKLGMAKKR